MENLKYDKSKDEYICPNNKRLQYEGTHTEYSKLGYPKTIRKYTCEACSSCPNKTECTKSQTNRSIQINLRQNELRAEARENCYPTKELDLEKSGVLSRKVSLDR